MGRHLKYSKDEDREKANLEYQNEYQKAYQKKPWKCDDCNIELFYGSRIKHLKSKKHLVKGDERLKCDK